MSHDLDMNEDGTANMAYSGKVPWHGLGHDAGGLMTASSAIVKAGLNWDVLLKPVHFDTLVDGVAGRTTIPKRRAVTRSTDDRFLGLVSTSYKPIQNVEAFEFFDALVEDGSAKYETAGALNGGRRVWMTAKVGDTFQVAGEDPHDLYLLLVNSHDGTTALKVVTTMVRVVCANTETMAIRGAKTEWSINHRKPLERRVLEARDALALSHKYVDAFEAEVQKMMSIQISADRFSQVLEEVLPEQKHATDKKVTAMVDLFQNSPTIKDTGQSGTVYGAYNAVTEYLSHKKSRSQEARMINNLFGPGVKFRNDAKAALLEMAR